MNDQRSRRAISSWTREQRYDILLLTECHGSATRIHELKGTFPSSAWCLCSNAARNGVGVVLNGNATIVEERNFSAPVLREDWQGRALCVKIILDNTNLTLVCIYAPAAAQERAGFFDAVTEWLLQDRNLLNEALFIGGDWNCVLQPTRDRLPSRRGNDVGAIELEGLVTELGLRDTWEYKPQPISNMTFLSWNHQSRIDRLYANAIAHNFIASTTTCRCAHSDHLALVAGVRLGGPARGPGRWIFNNTLLKDDRNTAALTSAWCRTASLAAKEALPPDQVFLLCEHVVASVAQILARFRNRQRVHSKIRRQRLLDNCTRAWLADPGNAQLFNEQETLKNAVRDEELHEAHGAAIRSRTRWLLQGEAPTRYFFGLAKSRSKRNEISAVRDEHGRVSTSSDGVVTLFANYYERLYTADAIDASAVEEFVSLIDKRITSEMRDRCDAPLTLAEATAAVSQMPRNKTPGITGLTAELYKIMWPVIGNHFVEMFNFFLARGSINEELCRGIIVVLFKKGERTDINNYRPISLLNVSYKLLSRILAQRLARTLETVIHPNQYGFVPKRAIQEAIITAQSAIDYINSRQEEGIVAMLDQRKAFDRVNHDFLQLVMQKFGYGNTFISLLRAIHANSSSQMFVNRSLSRRFRLSRGVRQGDPLSPFLYALAIEPLALAIRSSTRITGVRSPLCSDDLKLVMFADDITVFARGWEDVDEILTIASRFGSASNASINADKSEFILLGRLAEEDRARTALTLAPRHRGIIHNTDDAYTRLLGGSIGTRVNYTEIWQSVREKVSQALLAWRQCYLSLQGRCYIANVIGMGTIRYRLHNTPCPQEEALKLQRLLSAFIWGGRRDWVDRSTLALPRSLGGRGAPLVVKELQQIHLAWISSLVNERVSSWKSLLAATLPTVHAHTVGTAPFITNLLRQKPLPRSKTAPAYWQCVLGTWRKLSGGLASNWSPLTITEILQEPLWNNPRITNAEEKTWQWDALKRSGFNIVADIIDFDTGAPWRASIARFSRRIPDRIHLSKFIALCSSIPRAWLQQLASAALPPRTSIAACRTPSEALAIQVGAIEMPFAGLSRKSFNDAVIEEHLQSQQFTNQLQRIETEIHAHIDWRHTWELLSTKTVEHKIADFSWKLLRHAVPCRARVSSAAADRLCPVCHLDDETDMHIIWGCAVSKRMWCATQSLLDATTHEHYTVHASDALAGPLGNHDALFENRLAILLQTTRWLIWKHRCHVAHRVAPEPLRSPASFFSSEIHRTAEQHIALSSDKIFWSSIIAALPTVLRITF